MRKNKKSSNIQSQIVSLQRRIVKLRKEKKAAKNKETASVAWKYADNLKHKATEAELKFLQIVRQKKLDMIFQCPIYISKRGEIKKFYIADFCDKSHKIVIEIDGEYHFTPEQIALDNERSEAIKKKGYVVYRITNEDVFNGKSTGLLYNIYKRIGIDISSQ